jgi:putative transposase
MKKSRFSDEQIVGFLRQAEAGMAVKELCRANGFSDATFYKWRAKFGGMQASEATRLREIAMPYRDRRPPGRRATRSSDSQRKSRGTFYLLEGEESPKRQAVFGQSLAPTGLPIDDADGRLPTIGLQPAQCVDDCSAARDYVFDQREPLAFQRVTLGVAAGAVLLGFLADECGRAGQ